LVVIWTDYIHACFVSAWWIGNQIVNEPACCMHWQLQNLFIKSIFILVLQDFLSVYTPGKQRTGEKDEWQGIGGKIFEEELKKAKLWRQYVGAGKVTHGSEVRQTIRLNSSGRVMEIRKTRANSLDFSQRQRYSLV